VNQREISIASRYSALALLFAIFVGLFILPTPAHAVGTAATAPTNIVATVGSGSIIVTWAAPAYPGDGVVNYSVDYSTDGASWTNASSTIVSSATNYTINGLTPGTPYYIRMTAINGAGSSPYGYPWTKIYATSTQLRDGSNGITYDSGYGPSDTAAALNSTYSNNVPFTRVRYHLEFDSSTGTAYANADVAKWNSGVVPNYGGANALSFTSLGATVSNLKFPDLNTATGIIIDTNVADLTVVSSNQYLNVSGKIGRLEIWPWNYQPYQSGLPYPGSATLYDYDDAPLITGTQSSQGNYGSFQVHDVSDNRTIIAWNRHAGPTAEIGIGSNPSVGSVSNANPDWTFCAGDGSNCVAKTNFHIDISINIPVTPTAILSTTVSLSGGSTALFRTATTLTATASTIGKVTFYANGKRIPGCINVPTLSVSPFTATCSWRPAVHNSVPIKATFTPFTGLASNSSTLRPIISARSGNR